LEVMNAELPEVFTFVDANIGAHVVEKFHHLRENGLFLDVTINVSNNYTELFISLVDNFLRFHSLRHIRCCAVKCY